MVATGSGGPGLFTQSNPEDRRVVPDEVGDRTVFKVVYVVLESQYQSSLTAACKRINAGQVRQSRVDVASGWQAVSGVSDRDTLLQTASTRWQAARI